MYVSNPMVPLVPIKLKPDYQFEIQDDSLEIENAAYVLTNLHLVCVDTDQSPHIVQFTKVWVPQTSNAAQTLLYNYRWSNKFRCAWKKFANIMGDLFKVVGVAEMTIIASTT